MSKQWAPEPWKSWEDTMEESQYITDADFKPITFAPDAFDDATRDRIIACVNACAGVPTALLVQMARGAVETACPLCGAITHSSPLPADVQQRRLRCMWCHKIFPSSDSKGATDATSP